MSNCKKTRIKGLKRRIAAIKHDIEQVEALYVVDHIDYASRESFLSKMLLDKRGMEQELDHIISEKADLAIHPMSESYSCEPVTSKQHRKRLKKQMKEMRKSLKVLENLGENANLRHEHHTSAIMQLLLNYHRHKMSLKELKLEQKKDKNEKIT